MSAEIIQLPTGFRATRHCGGATYHSTLPTMVEAEEFVRGIDLMDMSEGQSCVGGAQSGTTLPDRILP